MQPQSTSHRHQITALLLLVGVTVVEGVPLFMVVARDPGRFVSVLRAPPLAWALALVVAVIFIWLSARRQPFIRERLFTFSSLTPLAVPMALVTGVFEELFFRGFLMNWAMKDGWSVVGQVSLSAVLFGAAHGVWGLFGGSARVAVGSAVTTGLLGAALAAIYVLGGRSVGPCALAHVLINLVLEPWLILCAVSGQWSRRSR